MVLLLFIFNMKALAKPGFHFQIDFSSESSDNIEGWITNLRAQHPKGGVAVSSKGYARFRNAIAAMKTELAYANAGTLTFKLTTDSYGTNNPSFKVFTSTSGEDWENGWVEVFATSYNEVSSEGLNVSIDINSGTEAVFLKLESNNDDVDDSGTEYSFRVDDLMLTNTSVVDTNSVEVGLIRASCLTVSSETLLFQKDEDEVYLAHDSIGFDAQCEIFCEPLSGFAQLEIIKSANPFPGKSDTAIFKITSKDNTKSRLVKAVVARSVYQTKFGFLASISNNTDVFDAWTFGGKRYPSGTKGNGAAFPGENAMRIYDADGSITTPKFSSIGELSFVAKFSNTDGESLKVQKSFDGLSFTDIKTYSPDGGVIPKYDGEKQSDTLSNTQTLFVNERNVYIRFQYVSGKSASPRIMIDDIACKAMFTPNESFKVSFIVKDFDQNEIEGANVTLGDVSANTDGTGSVVFPHINFQMDPIPYTVSGDGFPTKSGTILVQSNLEKKVVLIKQELDIFLALGQSNMAGRADIENLTEKIDGAFLLNDVDEWEPASNPMNIYSNIRKDADIQKLGPSYSFAKTMTKYIDKPVCIINNARGGTSIVAFSEGGDYYQPMMERIKKAKDFGTVKAAIWHQGEANRSNFGSYLGRLNTLVENMRAELDTNFYFVAGQLGGWGTKYSLFNENLTHIQSNIQNSAYVVNDRLWHRGDETHFNTSSQLLLGQRYAQRVLERVYNIKIAIFEFSFSDELFVTCGSDTIRSGEKLMYTTLWDDDLELRFHARDEQQFESLTINGAKLNEVEGKSVYILKPDSRDTVFSIEANLKGITSLQDLASEKLWFYPNPATEKLVFSGGRKLYDVVVFDLSGRVVLERVIEREMDIHNLKAGTYMLKLSSDGQQLLEKLIVL